MLCPAIRVGAIEGREAMPFRFRDSFFQFCLFPPYSISVICAFYDSLDKQLVHNNVRVCFCIRITGMKNVLFMLLVKAELFQIVLPIKQCDDKIALASRLLPFDKT